MSHASLSTDVLAINGPLFTVRPAIDDQGQPIPDKYCPVVTGRPIYREVYSYGEAFEAAWYLSLKVQ